MSSEQPTNYTSLIEYMKEMNLENAAMAFESLFKKAVDCIFVI